MNQDREESFRSASTMWSFRLSLRNPAVSLTALVIANALDLPDQSDPAVLAVAHHGLQLLAGGSAAMLSLPYLRRPRSD